MGEHKDSISDMLLENIPMENILSTLAFMSFVLKQLHVKTIKDPNQEIVNST